MIESAPSPGEFQVMPPLSADEYAALRADITERGVLVPVARDQHGRILDGHHRIAIAAALGVDCPTEVHHAAGDDEARDLALTLNLARRHLTREQRRELISAEIQTRPDDSDRAIARRLSCDHKTVGSVRRELSGEIPHPEPDATERWFAWLDEFEAESQALLAQKSARLDEINNSGDNSPELLAELAEIIDEARQFQNVWAEIHLRCARKAGEALADRRGASPRDHG